MVQWFAWRCIGKSRLYLPPRHPLFANFVFDLQYACVRTFPDTLGHQKDFTMTTMAIVLITVFGLGGTTELALKLFKIDTNVDEHTYMRETLREPIVSSRIRNFGVFKTVCSAESLGFLCS